MKHISKSILLATTLLSSCTIQHPTLDDFIIDENEITIDAKELFSDPNDNNVSYDKDATGELIASSNPDTQVSVKNVQEDTLPIPAKLDHSLPVTKAPVEKITPKIDATKNDTECKGAQKEAVSQPNVNTTDVQQSSSEFISRPSNFGMANAPMPVLFDANMLGDHLLGKDNDVSQQPEALKTLNEYTRKLMSLKASYEDRNLSKMRAWRDQNLISVPKADETLFYPFSGPDVVNMLTFFPNQQTYVMMGMEYVGTPDTVKEWQKPLSKEKMNMIQKSVESVFIRSFFITMDMSSDFSRNGTRGVLPGMLLMLRLLDRDIKSVQWVALNQDGSMRYLTEAEAKVGQNNFGLEVTVVHPTQGFDQKIYYFKTDLENKGITRNSGLNKLISQRLGTTTTFVKSASFLMHMKEFTWMRDTVLTISRAILQDDSGVPFKYFKERNWDRRLFGQYQGPYGSSFESFQQPELQKAFNALNPVPLDFRFGYGYSKIPAHLLLFLRKGN